MTAAWVCLLTGTWARAQTQVQAAADFRLRTVLYSADEVYRLPGRIGYEIDLQFESGEALVGLGAGDIEGLTFKAESNHLFIKPKARNVRTNLTVLTNRRTYHFDYATLPSDPDPDEIDVVYAMRFVYPSAQAPSDLAGTARSERPRVAQDPWVQPSSGAVYNMNYWYCGSSDIRPVSAWDDGVQTHVVFGARSELPAMFVSNDDGSESLVNFTVVNDQIIVHRVARRFIVRRGKLVGCIVNKSYAGGGLSLSLKTVSPVVERTIRSADHEASR